MKTFDRLVSEQVKTMEKLLLLQSELERCQQLEGELRELEKEAELEIILIEIAQMNRELKNTHLIFEKQTDEVINSYRLNQPENCRA